VPLSSEVRTVTLVRRRSALCLLALGSAVPLLVAFSRADVPPRSDDPAGRRPLPALQAGPIRSAPSPGRTYKAYSPYDSSNARTDPRYDVQYVNVDEWDNQPDHYYFYLNFAQPVFPSQFGDAQGSWAGVMLDTDLDGEEDVRLATTGKTLPTTSAYVAGAGPAGCSVLVFSDIGQGAKWLGFRVEKTCIGPDESFGVRGYADHIANDDSGFDYAPEKFWRFTKPGGAAQTTPPPAWSRTDGVDRPDDRNGYQIKMVYVATPSATNFGLVTDGIIERWVGEAQSWLKSRVGSGLLFDTHQGRLDISYLRIDHNIAMDEPPPGNGFRDESDLLALYRSLNKSTYRGKTVVFVVDQTAEPGGDYCGYAGMPGDYAVVLPNIDNCGEELPHHAARNDGLSYPAKALIHEVFHSYGVPHVCVDDTDLMIGSPECPDARDENKPVTLDSARSLYLGAAGAGVDVTTLRVWEDGRGSRRPDLREQGTCWARESCLLESPLFTKNHRLQLQVRDGNRWRTVFSYKGALDGTRTDRHKWRYAVNFSFASPGNVSYRLYVPPSGRFAGYVGPAESVRVVP